MIGLGVLLVLSQAVPFTPLPRVSVAEGRFQVGGAPFVPRGVSYMRLDCALLPHCWHITFDPAIYDRSGAELALAAMQARGYNVVRVWIDPGQWDRNNGINGPDS